MKLGKKRKLGQAFLTFMVMGLPLSCSDGSDKEALHDASSYGTPAYLRDPVLNVRNVSQAEGTNSHNAGDNCVACHQEYGPGRGLFTIAGSVAGEDGRWLENPVVELYSAPPDQGGSLLLAIEGDRLGNFFTTEEVPLPESPLFVRVRSTDGALESHMPFPISNGSCNHCHTGGFRVTASPPGTTWGGGGEPSE